MNGTTHRRRDCPGPMIAVNTQFCIEPEERDTVEFYNAALACAQAGYRLCTWGEFIVAWRERRRSRIATDGGQL